MKTRVTRGGVTGQEEEKKEKGKGEKEGKKEEKKFLHTGGRAHRPIKGSKKGKRGSKMTGTPYVKFTKDLPVDNWIFFQILVGAW